MSNNNEQSVSVNGSGFIMALFLFAYIAGFYERVDCALGSKSACEIVEKWNTFKLKHTGGV